MKNKLFTIVLPLAWVFSSFAADVPSYAQAFEKSASEAAPVQSTGLKFRGFEPAVDQLGPMQSQIEITERAELAFVLFIQVCVMACLAVALLAQWPMLFLSSRRAMKLGK